MNPFEKKYLNPFVDDGEVYEEKKDTVDNDEDKKGKDKKLRSPPLIFPKLDISQRYIKSMNEKLATECIEKGFRFERIRALLIQNSYDLGVTIQKSKKEILDTYERSISGPEFCREFASQHLNRLWV